MRFGNHSFRSRRLRRMASVPRGFLRYFVLQLLKRKPMSGSEIMEEIETQTDGRWKPSPGSVYPLLAWLQDNAHIEEEPTEEPGMKRYALTEKGRKLLEEGLRDRAQEKMELLGPMAFNGFLLGKSNIQLRKATRRLVKSLFNLKQVAVDEENQIIEQVADYLNQTSMKIEELTKKLTDEKSKAVS